MLCCECGPRAPPELKARRQRPTPDGDESPVSAYCNGELDKEEQRAFEQIQVKNLELRGMLGITNGRSPMPDVEQQVKEHVARLRKAVAENVRLRHGLVEVQASLVERGLPLISPQDFRQVPLASDRQLGAPQASTNASSCPSEADPDEQERQSATVMSDIQKITQSNIELISRYDEMVKDLEQEVTNERERQRLAEINTMLPASMRSLSQPGTPPRSANRLGEMATPPMGGAADDSRQLDEFRQKRAALKQLEEECHMLEQAIQAAQHINEDAKARALQELQVAHEVQKEELAHFKRLVEEKREKGVSSSFGSSPQQTDTGALLVQELEHLREHLRDTQMRGEQERIAAEAQANELRRELQELQEEQHTVALQRDAGFRDLEEVKRSNDGRRTPPATSERPFELQRMHGEAVGKEIERARRRINLLDAKVEQLETEAQDLRQRANRVRGAMPDAPSAPEALGQNAELRELVASRDAELQNAKRKEDQLQEELAANQQALEAANLEAIVMEQKLKLLQSRTET